MSQNLAQYIQFTNSGLPQGMSASMSGFSSPDEANAAVTASNQAPVRDFAAEQAAALSATTTNIPSMQGITVTPPSPTDVTDSRKITDAQNMYGYFLSQGMDSIDAQNATGFNPDTGKVTLGTPYLEGGGTGTAIDNNLWNQAQNYAAQKYYDDQWIAAHPQSSGGGGLFGGGDFFGGVGDFFSGAFSGLGDALTSLDPSSSIGNALAESDKFINREIPGAYALPIILGTAYATGYLDPSMFTSTVAEGGTAAATGGAAGTIATEAAQEVFFNTLAAGGTSAEATDAALAAQAAASNVLTTPEILSSTGFTPTADASFAIDPNAAYTTGATTPLPADIGAGTSAPLQGPTYQELGVTGVPEGGMGPTYGEMGFNGLNQGEAINAADSASQLAQIKDALSTANDVRQVASTANIIAKLLTGGSQLSNATQNLATGQTGVGSAIPALLRGNQNPFLQSQSFEVQNKKPNLAQLANLLKQG